MQEEIHELLLSFAEAGANVVRLKGGDPLVIGTSYFQYYSIVIWYRTILVVVPVGRRDANSVWLFT